MFSISKRTSFKCHRWLLSTQRAVCWLKLHLRHQCTSTDQPTTAQEGTTLPSHTPTRYISVYTCTELKVFGINYSHNIMQMLCIKSINRTGILEWSQPRVFAWLKTHRHVRHENQNILHSELVLAFLQHMLFCSNRSEEKQYQAISHRWL